MRSGEAPDKHGGRARMGGEGEDNKKPGSPPRSQAPVNPPRCWIRLGHPHLKHTRRSPVASCWLSPDQAAASLSSLGATSQTRWRTRPCLGARRSAHKRCQLPPIPVQPRTLCLATVSANLSTGVRRGWRCCAAPPDLT